MSTSETESSNKPAYAVIPARGGSKGLPGKNLMELGGVPMLVRAINAINEAAEYVGKVIVSSDDPDILVCANRNGAIPVTRPAELATDTARIDDAVVHATKHVYGDSPPPICLVVQPNVPIWKAGTIEKAVFMMLDGALTGVVTACEAAHPPEWLMKRDSRNMLRFYRGGGTDIPVNRQQLPRPLFIDGQVVACLSSTLLGGFQQKPLGICGERIGAIEREAVYATDIDDRWDFIKAEAFLGELDG